MMALNLDSLRFLDICEDIPPFWDDFKTELENVNFSSGFLTSATGLKKCAVVPVTSVLPDVLQECKTSLDKLINDSLMYDSPHETPKFRKISEGLLKLQIKLDGLDIDEDAFREQRKTILKKINSERLQLLKKVHQKCPQCN